MQYVDKADLSVPVEKKSKLVDNFLKGLLAEHGKVTAQMIVNEAAAPKNPVHNFFEWDDTAAGRKYRLMQAMNMILSSKFVCMLTERKENDVIADAKGNVVRKLLPSYDGEHGFKARAEVLDDVEARKAIVDRKIAVLRSWCASVVDISELLKLRKLIANALPA